jgi:hypothetical protein
MAGDIADLAGNETHALDAAALGEQNLMFG